jgi:hypothetical protein
VTDPAITQTKGDRLDPLELWAGKARDYAHQEANWVDFRLGETPQKHADMLRYKYRLQGWTTALTFWYTVDVTPDGSVWRHLSIACSQSDLGAQSAEEMQGQVNTYKQELLELFTPMVRMFYPLSTKVATRFDVGQPVPVSHPETNQVSFRVPMTFHFLVPWTADGKEGPVKLEEHERRNVATTDPRVLGWRPGSEEPDNDRPVLGWWDEGRFYCATLTTGGLSEFRVWVLQGLDVRDPAKPPTWWRELPEPPVPA